ncbi:MAG: hypothetical protein KGR98_04905, partial [Verrucomicrobia bacterium]|nr:hypothetical protein [Verrucomicrobiota bacterium]
VFSSDFASQESANPIGARAENPGCGYDFASGVHKYLYGADDPVNIDDPSGNEGELVEQVGLMSIQQTLAGAALSALARVGAFSLIDYFSREQLYLFHVTDGTIVKIAQRYNGGAFRTETSAAPMYFATTSPDVGSLLMYGIGYPLFIKTYLSDPTTVAGIQQFCYDLKIPYMSLPPDLQKPDNKPVAIVTSKKGSVIGRIWFNGGISVQSEAWIPGIYSTYVTIPGETVSPEHYRLIGAP